MNPELIREIVRQEMKAYSDRNYFNHHFQLADGVNVQLAKGTGTKIGTEITQKLGFFGKTPTVQLLKANYNNWATAPDVAGALRDLGFVDQI